MQGWAWIAVAVVVVLVVAGFGIASWRGRDGDERRAAQSEARQRRDARREDESGPS